MLKGTSFESLEDALEKYGKYVIPARGCSMYPMLRSYIDPVLVVPLQGRLKPYDVAVYRSLTAKDTYIVHRVLGTFPDHYIIRGDNCSAKEFVVDGRVVGVVAGFWRGRKFIPVDNSTYRCYSRIWVAINPLVRVCRALHIIASKCFHRIFPNWHPLLHR